MNNYQKALDLENTALDSNGLAMDRYGIYMESVGAKQSQLKATWESFYATTLNSDMVKNMLDTAITFVDWMDKMGAGIPILAGIISGLLFVAVIKLNGGLEKLNFALIKTNLLAGGLPLLIGLVTAGITALVYQSKKCGESSRSSQCGTRNF